MNIPDEVGEQALKADDTWVFIAAWARKEALQEAEEVASPFQIGDEVSRAIRALAEGDN